VVAGFANHRALELLVEAGFTPLKVIRIGTMNGAVYLGGAPIASGPSRRAERPT